MADLPAEVNVAIDAEIAELEGRMASPREWFHDKAGQERIKELYEQQDTGTAPSPAPAPAAQRMAVIEQAMKDSAGEYWKSPDMQNEYLAILEAEDAGPPLAVLDEVTGRLDAALGASLDGVTAAVAGLDDTLQVAMARELAQPVGETFPATTEDIAAFAKTTPGALLLSRWGSDGPQRLGAVMARVDRFEAGLSDADYDNWQDFFHNRISPQERAAILGEL